METLLRFRDSAELGGSAEFEDSAELGLNTEFGVCAELGGDTCAVRMPAALHVQRCVCAPPVPPSLISDNKTERERSGRPKRGMGRGPFKNRPRRAVVRAAGPRRAGDNGAGRYHCGCGEGGERKAGSAARPRPLLLAHPPPGAAGSGA